MPDNRPRADRPGAGIPQDTYLTTLAERHGKCICTWVVHDYQASGKTVFRLKYRNVGCPAAHWHSAMERAHAARQVETQAA